MSKKNLKFNFVTESQTKSKKFEFKNNRGRYMLRIKKSTVEDEGHYSFQIRGCRQEANLECSSEFLKVIAIIMSYVCIRLAVYSLLYQLLCSLLKDQLFLRIFVIFSCTLNSNCNWNSLLLNAYKFIFQSLVLANKSISGLKFLGQCFMFYKFYTFHIWKNQL